MLIATFGAYAGPSSSDPSSKPLAEMSFEELVNVPVDVGTLGTTELRKVPATITTITSQEVQDSGARSLDELLEIYVPNMLYLRHNWEADHIGMRGLIGDVDNNYLILVNGKVMNNLVHAGALSERDLNLLGDIQEVQVIRGPGSAVYGAGALIGLINIKTFDGKTFQGTEMDVKAGEGEEYYSAEIKSGFKLGEKVHVFLYGGISDLAGANNSLSPAVLGVSGMAYDGTPVKAGQNYPIALPDDRKMYHDAPPMKFHGELTMDDFTLWARFTRGGEAQPFEQRWLVSPPAGLSNNAAPGSYQVQGVGYEQISAGLDYKREISENWELAGRLGYSVDDYVRTEFDAPLDANREDLCTARLLATWNSSPTHSLTFGMEYLHGEFGLPTLGYPGGPALSVAWAGVNPTSNGVSGLMPRWSADTFSYLAEDRWEMTPRWSLFTDLRVDKNDQTDYMFSPRMALVCTPSSKDTVKLVVSQAVKSDVAENLELERELSGGKGETETLRAVELSYNRLLGEHFSVGVCAFYNDFKLIGWDNAANQSAALGDEQIVGAELEAAYHWGTFGLALSHGYSQLVGFRSYVSGVEGQAITAEPYGFGDDLNHWSTHITKLQMTWQPVKKLRFWSSLRVFWGWPGSEEYSNYANSQQVDETGLPLEFLRNPGYNPYNQIQARLNVGASYAVTKRLTASIHGYNLLGLIDSRFNDRFVMFSSSMQGDAPAVEFRLSYRF